MHKSPPDLKTSLRELIVTPSMSSVIPSFDASNRTVIDLLAGWFESLGLGGILPLPTQPHKANLLATLGPVDYQNKGLMLAGDTDTVPYEEKFWQHTPFQLTSNR